VSRIDTSDDERRLSAELDDLKRALRGLRAPPPAAATLAAVRARCAALRAEGGRPARRPRVPLAAAATIAVVAMAALVGVTVRRDLPVDGFGPGAAAPPAAGALEDRAAADSAAFRPLLGSAGISPGESYSVVRVRIPLASLAPAQDSRLGGSIEADLLVGEDGLAAGIRFGSADVSYAAASPN
jgi:hypothetical protein